MPIHNSDIANIFNLLADLLEIHGANQYRIRAYRNAARTVSGLSKSAVDMVKDGEDLSGLRGIGKDLAGKIETIVGTGKLPLLEEIKREVPTSLSEMSRVAGLGPKRVRKIYVELGVDSLPKLKRAAEKGKIRGLEGFGRKTEENIIQEIGSLEGAEARVKLPVADEVAGPFVEYLGGVKGVKQIEVAGSYRRRKDTVGDLDILVSHKKDSKVMEKFTQYEDIQKVVSKGTTKSTVILRSGLQVDLRAVAQASYGAALHYFTGSKAHNIAIRKIAVKKGYKINEYGVFKGNKRIAGKTEKEVYKKVNLLYIEPELRENRGEIEAAKKNKLPKLVSLGDIRGDLHAHTKLTDGNATLNEMAEAAKERGYDYLAITEHSKHVTVAKGLKKKDLQRHIKRIDKANEKLSGIRLLKGIELDILEDGKLDLPDDILGELDLVVCSVHYKFNLSRQKQTERILKAIDSPFMNILAHPTGRLISERDPYDVDMERILKACKDAGCFVELNAYPHRLDVNDIHAKMAKDMGVKIAISTDAHSVSDLDFMRYGVGQARRGWLEADDIINTRKWGDLKKLLKRK